MLNAPESYDGSNTPLIIISEHNMRFFCGFDGISQYPFEIEACSFHFYLDGPANIGTNINGHMLGVPARRFIGQYEIKGWTKVLNLSINDSGKKTVKVTVKLTKSPVSIILVTYLPSLLMNIINQATNYITGDSKYGLIITVNITSMVVLATIYISVSTSLPSTPNIKPVEVWLLLNLAYPFFIIMTNVMMQVSMNFCFILRSSHFRDHFFIPTLLLLPVIFFTHYFRSVIFQINLKICLFMQIYDPENNMRKIHPSMAIKTTRLNNERTVFLSCKIITSYLYPALYIIVFFLYAVVYAVPFYYATKY